MTKNKDCITDKELNSLFGKKLNKPPLESFEQEQIFKWRNENMHKWPELSLLFATGNGLRLRAGQAKKAKDQGILEKGVPDIFLPVKQKDDKTLYPYHGLFIELKRIKGSKISSEQKAFLAALEGQGYKAVVCYGHKEAIENIKEYLGITE